MAVSDARVHLAAPLLRCENEPGSQMEVGVTAVTSIMTDERSEESPMAFNRDRAAEFVLALMYVDLHDGDRAWKVYPWDVLGTLHEVGLISDPKGRARSVALTAEGLARAESAFNSLLASGTDSPVRAPKSVPGASPRSGLSQLQTALVERLLAPMCAPHPNPAVASQVRRGFRIDDLSVVLFESRPAFLSPREWLDLNVAKFRFVKSRAMWQLFCQFRDLKWHSYEPLPEARDLAVLVNEVKADPTGIFWG